jgi:anti-sigma factor RsiW
MAVPADDLTCRELVELVTEYLEAALAPGEVVRFEAHLARCPECRAHLDAMRMTIQLVGRLPEQSLSWAAEADLLTAFRGWRRGRTQRRSRGPFV